MMKKKFRTYYDAAPPSAWMGPEVSQCVKLWGDVGFMVPWHKPDALENVSFSHKKISSITWHLDKNHIALYTFHFDHVTQRDTTQHATTPREYHVAHTPNVNVSGNFTPEWRCAEAISL